MSARKRVFPISLEEEKEITLDETKFIFAQGEKLLKETISASDLIITRTTTLITLVSASMFALFSFIINRLITLSTLHISDIIDPFTLTAILGLGYLLLIAWKLYLNVKPIDYKGSGSMPDTLFESSYFDVLYTYSPTAREKAFYLTEIYSYNKRIPLNLKVNAQRWKRLNACIKYVIAAPVILTIIFIIWNAIYHHIHCLTYP
ncbi:MAG: hypothetical protein JWO03_2385 [Bacteroidetes bacterium]|nr:hypothetical protein [Bacteroidota bacterium]